jgi:RNA 2',3'-cyclic 3'-phosphodiesterase
MTGNEPHFPGGEPHQGDDGERADARRTSAVASEPSARLFFALWPDDAMQAALANAVAAIVREAGGRAVPATNSHLTLAFLGAVPQRRFEALRQVAAQVAYAFNSQELPIALALDTVEHWRKPQILCATASETSPPATDLAEALKHALTAGGFAPDLKPFRVHATFARKVRNVTGELHIKPVRWSFRDFRLIESRTAPEGSSYSTVEKWVLDKRDR